MPRMSRRRLVTTAATFAIVSTAGTGAYTQARPKITVSSLTLPVIWRDFTPRTHPQFSVDPLVGRRMPGITQDALVQVARKRDPWWDRIAKTAVLRRVPVSANAAGTSEAVADLGSSA